MSFRGEIFVLLTAFAVSWTATKVLIRILSQRGVLDIPNVRSSHKVPTPRGGGLGILAGLAAGCAAAALLSLSLPHPGILAGTALVAVTGALDDYTHRVSIGIRLLLQCLAAAMVVVPSGGLGQLPLPQPWDVPLGALGPPLAIVWIVGVTNVYNFLDGIDGFAASQAVIAGVAAATIFAAEGSAIGLAIAGASGAFLLHNWHPARIFMGDVGSEALGFLLASLPFQLPEPARSRSLIAIALCLWFFLADGLFALLRRLCRGEKFWTAHRSHLYQRLVGTGLRQDEVVLAVSGLSLGVATLAVVAHRSGEPRQLWMALLAAAATFLFYVVWTSRREGLTGQAAPR